MWAPWSAPAAALAATLTRAADGLPANAVMVDVALDYVDDAEVRNILGPSSARSIHLLGRPTELEPWGAFPVLPVTWLVDGQGVVRDRQEGFMDAQALAAMVRRLAPEGTASPGSRAADPER